MCRNLEGSHVIKEGKKRLCCVFKNHVLATDLKKSKYLISPETTPNIFIRLPRFLKNEKHLHSHIIHEIKFKAFFVNIFSTITARYKFIVDLEFFFT